MNPGAPVTAPSSASRARRTLFLRWSWLALAVVTGALYLGWGFPRPWGLLAIVPAVAIIRLGPRAARDARMAGWRTVILAACLLSAAGSLLLPLNPPERWLDRRALADEQILQAEIDGVRTDMRTLIDRAEKSLNVPGITLTQQQRIAGIWVSERGLLGERSAALILIRPGDEPAAWAGSPFLVPTRGRLVGVTGASSDSTGDRFVVTGDTRAAMALQARRIEQGVLAVSVLLAREPAELGQLAGVEPVLDRRLPSRISGRLRIAPSSAGAGELEVTTGPWTNETLPFPVRGVFQGLLLLLVVLATLGLLSRDDSVVRGIVAAPLIYASVVPVALGMLGRPLELELIAPSWNGHQLTNQAFLAVGAAALAVWFAMGRRSRLHEKTGGNVSLFGAVTAMAIIVVLWGLGLALLQDLYRFAPTWFWARVSFLPAGRDLVGWLIAIAMTLVLVAGSGGLALMLERRLGRTGIYFSALLAAAGATGAWATGAWSGTLWVGLIVAPAATLSCALFLRSRVEPRPLTLLLGIALIGAAAHLPVKWDLGRLLAHNAIEESARSLREAGVGLAPQEVSDLRDRLVRQSEQRSDSAPRERGRSEYDMDREAYLLWQLLNIGATGTSSGVRISSPEVDGPGEFATSPHMFTGVAVDSFEAEIARGVPRLVLTGGSPAIFGEETLLMGVPGPVPGSSLVAATKRRPMAFLAVGEENIWAAPDPAGTAERSGRLVGALYLRVYDEAYQLLTVPRTVLSAPEGATVPDEVVVAIRAVGGEGVWYRRGWWARGGADEYYFLLEAPGERLPVPGVVVSATESGERRIAVLGQVRPGLWGRTVEALNLILLFAGAVLVLAWLPAYALTGSGMPMGRRLRSVSFRTRLLIPLLVVALVPMIALWLFTRTFILNREASAWEESLDRSVYNLQRAVLRSSEVLASDLAREAYRGSMASIPEMLEGTQWAVFDAELVKISGNLMDALADRIPIRETVLGRGPSSFVIRLGDAWSVAIAPIGSGYGLGAALVVQPMTERLLRQTSDPSPWQVDLFLDGRLQFSTDPAPYTAGLLPRMLPVDVDWEGSRGRDVGVRRWGDVRGLRYLFAYRPLTDYVGVTVATIAQRRFGMWGLRDPELDRLFATVASIYLLLVGAVTLVALLVARRISEPIGSLTRSARRVSGGDLEVEIPITRGDEVGGLQKAFRQMLIALRENRARIAQAERERAWQEMARQVAHEIKNPLTPMQLSAQFLKRAYDEGAEGFDRIISECTESIVEQVEELRRIANEFSAYSRLPLVSRTPTILNEPVEEALNLFTPALADGVTIERELTAGLPAVPLDPEQIRRVVINLIRNAIDAVGESGTLTVRTGSDDTGVWLQVADTGEGIAPEVQERLFEPYFSTKTDGTGLGLAITRAVVDAHGGSLSVDSRPGEGTTMTARFPLN